MDNSKVVPIRSNMDRLQDVKHPFPIFQTPAFLDWWYSIDREHQSLFGQLFNLTVKAAVCGDKLSFRFGGNALAATALDKNQLRKSVTDLQRRADLASKRWTARVGRHQ